MKLRATQAARHLLIHRLHRGRGLPPPWAYRGAFFFVLAVSGLALGCGAAPAPPAAAQPREAPKPLVGRIWSPKRHGFVDVATVENEAKAARYVLLGEKHDNPEHHAHQREILASLSSNGRAPAVVFEMVDVDQQTKLDAAPREPDAIADAVAWGARGWKWPLYRPIVALALERGLPIVAGNYPHAKIKELFHAKEDPVDPETKKALGIDRPLPEAAERELEEELAASHCGKLPKEILPVFALAQRLRDGQMAERLRTRATKDGAVLVAGAGHVRRDRGVPWYLPPNESYAVGFVEVEPGKNDPKDYEDAYDAVWFTPPVAREDPCASFGK